MKSDLVTAIFVISIMIGIAIGKYIPQSQKSKVYLFNESRFFTMSSLGILSEIKDKDQLESKLSNPELNQIKNLMSKLNVILASDYKNNVPILVEKKDKNLKIHSQVEIVDITNEVTKRVLGEKRWEQIGKTFLQ